MKLTAKSIRDLVLPSGKTEKLFWDEEIPGFGLRLRAGGSRNWVFQYALGEKQRRLSLGAATEESFKTLRQRDSQGHEIVKLGIREQAAQLHARVKLGQDPAGDKTESRKRASETFEAVAKKYLAAKKTTTRPGTYTETERHILKHAKPLNGLQVSKIGRRDVADLLGTIRTRGPVAANRVRSTLSDFFGWAMSEGVDGIEANPVISTVKSKETSRERVLKDEELRAIWQCAGDDDHGRIIKLMMLTGQRADEIASLRRSEITMTTVQEGRIAGVVVPPFDIDVIDLPGERTKNGRPHLVPLSKPAFALLTGLTQRTNSDGSLRECVFGIGQGGFSGWSRCKERLDKRIEKYLGASIQHWRPHDGRRTMSTLMNDRLGVLPHVVEAILNHVSSHHSGKSGVAGTYNRALYLRERVEALNLWADHLASIVRNPGELAATESQAAA